MRLLTPLSYGTDQHGIICAYQFERNSQKEINPSNIPLYLNNNESGFVWCHLNLNHAGAERWLKETLGLKETFFEILHDGLHSTRMEQDEDVLIAVLNDVLYDFKYDTADFSTLWAYVTPRLVVTARLKPLRSIDRLRFNVKQGALIESPIELLSHLLHAQIDVLLDISKQITHQTDNIEDRILDNNSRLTREQLGLMRRLLVRLQRLLAPEPAAMFRLLNRPPLWFTLDDKENLRQAAEEFATIIRDTRDLQERIKLLQEERSAQINEQTNRSLMVLTIVSVMALPINIVAGLFGMNVGGIPLAESPEGFWIVVTLILSFTFIAGLWVYRKNTHLD